MKKLVNDPRHVVREMLEGVAAMTPGVALIAAHNVIVRVDAPSPAERRVAVISGGGAGHEPAPARYRWLVCRAFRWGPTKSKWAWGSTAERA